MKNFHSKKSLTSQRLEHHNATDSTQKIADNFLAENTHNNSSRYERIRVIGRGSFGVATLYRRKEDDSLVILKEINLHDLSASERQLTLNEVSILSKLDHPHIIGYYDSFEEEGTLMIEMEYADGGTLSQFLELRNKPFDEGDLLDLFEQMISAISYLHENCVLHRDIKTANVFLTREQMVKIGDFGISKRMGTETHANTILGTPYYLSPEICQGLAYNEKSDIWALGCCLYEMATLQRAFDAQNLAALVAKIVNAELDLVKIPSEEIRILARDMLQSDPEKRSSAKDVLEKVRCRRLAMEKDEGTFRFGRRRTFGIGVRREPRHRRLFYSSSMGLSVSEDEDPIDRRPTTSCQSALYTFDIRSGSLTPIADMPSRIRIKQIVNTKYFKTFLTDFGDVYSWGQNRFGQLGLGDRKNRTTPTKIEAFEGKNVKKIAAGSTFCMFIVERGIVMACGNRKFVGNGQSSDDWLKPKIVDGLLSENVIDLSCGDEHTAVLTDNGHLYVWGNGKNGRLGIGCEDTLHTPIKVEIPTFQLVSNVICGPDSTVLVTRSGTLIATGFNDQNKLNLNARCGFFTNPRHKQGDIDKILVPTAVKPFPSRVVSVVLGENHSGVILENGHVHLFGSNSQGELGLGNCQPANFCTPFRSVKALSCKVCLHLVCGNGFTMVGTSDNEIYFWGSKQGTERAQSETNTNFDDNASLRTPLIEAKSSKKPPKTEAKKSASNKKVNGNVSDDVVILQPTIVLVLATSSPASATVTARESISSECSDSGIPNSPLETKNRQFALQGNLPMSPVSKTPSTFSPPATAAPFISLVSLHACGSEVIALVDSSKGEICSSNAIIQYSESKFDESTSKEKTFKHDRNEDKSRNKLESSSIPPPQRNRRLSAPEALLEDVATWIRDEFDSAEFIPLNKAKNNGQCEMNESRKDTQTEGENTNYHKQFIGNKSREKQVELLESKLNSVKQQRRQLIKMGRSNSSNSIISKDIGEKCSIPPAPEISAASQKCARNSIATVSEVSSTKICVLM